MRIPQVGMRSRMQVGMRSRMQSGMQPVRCGLQFVIVSSLVFLLCCSGENSGRPHSAGTPEESTPEQVLEDFTAYSTKGGRKAWFLEAQRSQVYESRNIASLEEFSVKFYKTDKTNSFPTDEISSVIRAGRGELDISRNNFTTMGKTTVTTWDNELLECEDLRYVENEKKIFTDSSVVITRENSIIRGRGLEATPDLSVVVVKHNRVDVKR